MSAHPRRSPLKVALIAFGLTIVIGLVVGMVLIMAVVHPGENVEARGERLGQGLAQLSIFVGVIAYFIQRHRTKS